MSFQSSEAAVHRFCKADRCLDYINIASPGLDSRRYITATF